MKNYLVMMAAAVLMLGFSSCNVNDVIEDQPQVVSFSAGIDIQALPNGAPGTRAAGTTWGVNDAIGIFMVDNGTTTIAEGAVNKRYTTTGNDAFTSATMGDAIYYPMDAADKVDFIAYYPWAANNVLGTAIDVEIGTTQTTASQAGFDLLWAKANGTGGAGYDKSNTTPVLLDFDHRLSKIVMNCSADASVGTALTGMTVKINGMNTKNTFNLSTGALGTANTPAAITPRTVTNGSVYDAIILPGSYAAGAITVEFTVGGDTFIWTLTNTDATFVGGNEYTYAVTLTRTGITVTGTITPWNTINRGGATAD